MPWVFSVRDEIWRLKVCRYSQPGMSWYHLCCYNIWRLWPSTKQAKNKMNLKCYRANIFFLFLFMLQETTFFGGCGINDVYYDTWRSYQRISQWVLWIYVLGNFFTNSQSIVSHVNWSRWQDVGLFFPSELKNSDHWAVLVIKLELNSSLMLAKRIIRDAWLRLKLSCDTNAKDRKSVV